MIPFVVSAAVILYRCQAVPAHTNLRGSNLDSFGARRVSNMEVANHSSIEYRSGDFERFLIVLNCQTAKA